MRRLIVAAVACCAFLAAAGTALGHAYLISSQPASDAKLSAAPTEVTMTFSESVEILRPTDVDVVDGTGRNVTAGEPSNRPDKRVVTIPLKSGLGEGTYTVRYQILSADSHVVRGLVRFGIGPGDLAPPYLGGSTGAGPSESGAWSVSSRFFEIVGLGGLIGLLAFRRLVWAPALSGARDLAGAHGDAARAWMRDAFWVGFGVLAVGSMIAEGYLVVVQSASVLGVGVGDALRDASGISQVLGDTRFGGLVQLRGALLFALFASGAVLFMREYGSTGSPRPAAARGGELPTVLMAGLVLAVIGVVSAQGHASVATYPPLQVGAQLVHIAGTGVWLTGLLMVAVATVRLPRLAPSGGAALAARVLTRFSLVATAAITLIIVTGVIRAITELDDPTDLWQTGYGRSIVYKTALLAPIALLAFSNRRIVAALRDVARPNRATLRRVRLLVGAELVVGLAIVVVAALLAGQVPRPS
ncbi:MAG: copper resistance CopC/CopD family protein [Thermoleophilia bacterium]